MVRFIDQNRCDFGVEPICKELQVAPSTYYAAKSRQPSARAVRDAVMIPLLVALWQANYSVYGTRKLWKAAIRAGHDVGRDQVARLMHTAQICGVRRGKKFRTTTPDPNSERPVDLVNRVFSADRPNAL
jgi:putative transposase